MYRECQRANTDVRDVHRTLSEDEGGDVSAVGTFLPLSREAVCHSSLEGVGKEGAAMVRTLAILLLAIRKL